MATKITTRVLADNAVTDAKIADVTLTTATQSASDNTTKIATTAYVTTAIANLADSAPSTLNTLNELAAALGDDANFSTTVTNSIAAKLPLAGGTMTGNLVITSDGDGLKLIRSGYDSYALQQSTGNGLAIYNVTDSRTELFFKGDGNIGIGTTSPMSLDGNATPGLTVSSNGPYILLQDANNADKVRYISNNTGQFQFGIVGDNGISGKTEHMRIDSSGNVGIGAPSISSWTRLQVAGTAGAQDGAKQALYIQSPTTTANEGVGIRMSAASGSHEAVGIIGMVNNASGNAGAMTFHTYNLGATIPEAMRITNTGNVGIGTDAPLGKFVVSNSGAEGFEVFPGSASGQNSFQHYNRSGSAYLRNRNIASEFTFNLSGASDDAVTFKAGGNVGIGTGNPTEALEVNGSILCSNFTDEEGIFFRSGFSNTNKYNVSIMAKDHDGSSADGLSINGYDGISFCTGSNNRNEVVRITGGTSNTGDVLIGTLVNPVGTGLAVNAAINTSQTTAIEIQQATDGANKAAAALGIAIQNGGASTNAADLTVHVASGGSMSEAVRITSAGTLAPRHASGQGYLSFTHVKGGGNYINVKTNIYRNSKMYMLKILGHISYSGERIDTIITGYAYAPNQGQTSSTYHGITNHGTVGIAVYYSSDDYLCFRTTSAGSYNSIDIIGSSGANGYYQGGPIEILAYTSISGTGNHYA